MICKPCAEAADGVPGARHCDETGAPSWKCACQHRPPVRRADAETAKTTVVIHVPPDPPHIADAIRDVRRYGLGRR
ncbi:hypothetical protein [Streptomyces bullii]|uniref:Uncharacterized protein n=1 Tax=Streptomyces bullii TaxID=349910 RepID=A0ABW0UVD9_9ACTN